MLDKRPLPANKSSLWCTCSEPSVAGMFITQALSYPTDGLYRCSKSAPSWRARCSTSGQRMLGNPAQKHSLPRGCTHAAPHTLLALPAQCLESHPTGKLRGDWKSLPQCYFPANVSSPSSPLLTKRKSEWGAVEGWEHPCAQPGPHAASPQRVLRDHLSPPLLSPSSPP